jgi:carboxypeptidase family protein
VTDDMGRGARRLALAAMLFSLPVAPLAGAAEITGSVAGAVKDASGAALSGATAVVRGSRLPAEGQSVTTSISGEYRVPLLPPGIYSVARATASGPAPTTRWTRGWRGRSRSAAATRCPSSSRGSTSPTATT